jgi:2-methylcitrate dehydratase PrpD
MDARPATHDGTISGRMAAYAATLRYDDLPDDVRRLARLVLLDTLGCALAGSATDEVSRIRRAMLSAGGPGPARAWGTGESLSLPFAALVNGAAVHAREMDDFGGCAHSGSVVIPAALGAAALRRASGRELLTAIVIGYDIAKRAMDGGGGYLAFKKVGWHSTSTCGGFGAAAAVGRIMGLDAQALQWALGYAGSNAGGTWAFIPDGAMSKRVHPGLAAQSGVIAAHLAAEGVTAPRAIFETEWGGYYNTYVPGKATPGEAVAGLGSDFRIRLVGFKPYAACRGIHSSVDAILAMRREDGLRADDVTKVVVRGSKIHCVQLAKQAVQTTLDAQMSLPYGIAVALLTGGAMLDQYSTDAIRRPEILAFARKVEVVHDPAVADGAEPFVDVHRRDGRVLTRRVMVARGDCTNPFSEEDIYAKFRITAGTTLSLQEVAALEAAVRDIAEIDDVSPLIELLVPERPAADRKRVA